MHVSRFSQPKGMLTLEHVEMDIGYYIDENEEVLDTFTMQNIGAEGFKIVDSHDNIVESAPYGGHDHCWMWLINKAVEIEELNNGDKEGS